MYLLLRYNLSHNIIHTICQVATIDPTNPVSTTFKLNVAIIQKSFPLNKGHTEQLAASK